MLKLCYQQTTGSSHRHCQDHYQIHAGADKVIVAVADGHGGRPYVRSGLGARFACAAAVKLLRSGIDPEEFPQAVKEAFDRMVSKHLAHRPLADWELARLGRCPAEHAYGTTLLAAALSDGKATVFQLGDGEIHAVDPQGNFPEVLPPDENCYDNITTSMVQEKDWVLQCFRHQELTECSALMLFTDGYAGAWKIAQGLLDTETLHSHVESTLRNGRRGDDQTFVMVYSPQQLETESFRTGLQSTLQTIREQSRKAKQRNTLRKGLDELRVYLRLAVRRAEKLKAQNDPEYEPYLQKLKPHYAQYLQLQTQLETLGKE